MGVYERLKMFRSKPLLLKVRPGKAVPMLAVPGFFQSRSRWDAAIMDDRKN
jgi:hypothetical protein